MESAQSVEEILDKQLAKLAMLEMATNILDNKHGLREPLQEAHASLYALSEQVNQMKGQLEKMKEQNVEIKRLHSLYKKLDEKITTMTEHIPPALSEHLAKVAALEESNNTTPGAVAPEPSPKPSEIKEVDNTVKFDNTTTDDVKDCRKALFRMAEDIYTIEPLSQEEFVKIPKYMIGRQTLANVNAFVATINQIMKAKYSLLALGKAGARKKGELDLFMQFKKEESDAKGNGTEKIYFFTGDDYYREIKTKLDKTKLNLMTVLRHCKRLHEIRDGKRIRYQIIT